MYAQCSDKGQAFLQIAYFLPYITTPVVIGSIFSLLFDSLGWIGQPDFDGNSAEFWGSDRLAGTPALVKPIVILIVFWRFGGYYAIFYMAGLSNISPDLYEAADIDGANALQNSFKITIPQLRQTMIFCLFTGTIDPANAGGPMLLVSSWMRARVRPVWCGVDRSVLTVVCIYTILLYNE